MIETQATAEATNKRRRWGCTCGCLAVLTLLLFGAVGLFLMLFRSLPNRPYETYVSSQTSALTIIRLQSDDGGLLKILDQNLGRIEAQAARISPEEAKNIRATMEILRRFVQTFVHPEIFILSEPDTALDVQKHAAIVQGRTRLAVVLLKAILLQITERAQQPAPGVLQLKLKDPTIPYSAIVSENQFVIGAFPDHSRRLAESGLSKPAATRTSELMKVLLDDLRSDPPSATEDITIISTNENDRLESVLRNLETEAKATGFLDRLIQAFQTQNTSLSDVLGMRVSLDLISADKAKLSVSLVAKQADAAKRLGDGLRRELPVLQRALAASAGASVPGTIDLRVRGSRVVITCEITNLRPRLTNIFNLPNVTTSTDGTTATASVAP